MASNVPIIRQIAWISLVSQLIFMGLLSFLYHLANLSNPIFWGALTYVILSTVLRHIITRHHRKGMALVKQKKFQDAIPWFEKSYLYFTQNAWVDKYRYLTILSSSQMTYGEMALCNIAFCYGQLGDIEKTIYFYKKTLDEYPENGLAEAGLKMLSAIKKE